MKVHVLSLLVLLATTFFARQAFGQETSNWLPYFENDAITIELKHAERNDTVNGIFARYILLRVTNKTDQTVNAGFQKELSYNLSPAQSSDPVAITLLPHAAIEGSVDPGTDKALRIFSAHVNGGSDKVLTDYSLSHISTTIIED